MTQRKLHRHTLLGWAVAGALTLAAALPAPKAHGHLRTQLIAKVTHYWATGYPMASGQWPYVGAVACGASYPFGSTVITLVDGAAWQCLDTGYLAANQIDFYGIEAESMYGAYTPVEVVP